MNAVAQLEDAIPRGNGYHRGIDRLPRPRLNSADTEDPAVHCHNCGAAVTYHYCAVCGQGTKLHVPSAGEFLHEFVGHYVALEGRLWQSLWLLIRKPGLLTAEYLAGRRVRYVEPLRLYLTFSILFFAIFKYGGIPVANMEDGGRPNAQIERIGETGPPQDDLSIAVGKINPKWAQKVTQYQLLSDADKTRVITSAFFNYVPYAMFALMPVFALILKLLYLGSGRRYGEHLLFALHVNAFAFLAFGAITVVPFGLVKTAIVVWMLAYLPLAMQRVYGGAKLLTFLRWQALSLLHVLCIAVAIFAAFGLAVIA